MIPKFPEFKKLEINDRADVEAHTHKYPPYSDFNFTSLWAWDTSGERMISELNGNLVVRFTDYGSHEPFFSFIGDNESENTARELMQYASASWISPVLRLVPETSIVGISDPAFLVKEDRDNFDYLYHTSELAGLRGVKYKKKRQSASRFLRMYPDVYVEVGDLNSMEVQRQIEPLLRCWEDKKKQENKEYELEHEEAAINRLVQTANAHNLVVTGVFNNGTMIGFSIDEFLPSQYCVSHFIKADSAHKGVYDFLNNKVAQYLADTEVLLWNWEQDLGLDSLKRPKKSYCPVSFLKKYTIDLV